MRFELPMLLWVAPAAALVAILLAWWAGVRRIRLAASWSAALVPLAKPGRAASAILLALAADDLASLARTMHEETTPLARFWRGWDGSVDPAASFAALDQFLAASPGHAAAP